MGKKGLKRATFVMLYPGSVQKIWEYRRMGMSSREIADRVGTSHATVERHVTALGGMAPEPWKDPDRYLTVLERFRIKEMLQEQKSYREIGRVLGRAASTISREVKRGGGGQYRSRYKPSQGTRRAWDNRRRPKPLKITSDPQLLAIIQQMLDDKYSPEQVVGRLRREYPDQERLHVSHETIYKTIYLQARGGLKRDLQALTRTGRTIRQPRQGSNHRRASVKGMVSIWDRPAEALDRTIPGHWEGDLIIGENGASSIGTVVERRSNALILVWMDPTKSRVEALTEGLARKLGELPDTLKATLTWDQGTEMANHRQIAEMTAIDIYFADPHSPWQRATNENTNGLLRQYFPKGTDLSVYSQEDLDFVADQMNRRPRKRLEFATPYEVLSENLLR